MSQSEDDKHAEIMRRADQAHVADLENREEALDDLRFRAGGRNQWDVTVLRERDQDGRPVITANMFPHYIRQVTNEARENRPSVKVRPVDDDADVETAEVLEGMVRHIEDNSEAVSKAYILGIDNAATCGIGNWRITTEWATDDVWGQDILIEGIPNPLAVMWDPYAKSPDRSDAEWVFVIEDIPEEEYEAKYPDKAISDFAVGLTAVFWRDIASKTVRIAEYICKEPVKKKIGRTQDGKTIDLTKIPAPSVQFLGITETRDVETHKIVSYIVSGAGILKGPQELPGKYIPVVAIVGEEVHVAEHRVRYGLIRHAKDPQRLYNLWRSLQAETIALQPKAPFIATGKQIEKYKTVWSQANKRSFPYLPYDPDGTAPPPQRSAPPQASGAMTEEAMLSIEEMKATTGIYDAALGNRNTKSQSGVAIENLQKQSGQSNSHFADNLALSIRHTGRIVVDYIINTQDTEKFVRLLNEDGTNKGVWINKLIQTENGAQYLNDLSLGKYDVTIKTGPSYATRRQESADFLMQFMQTMPDSAHFVADLLAKNLDAPGAEELAKRFRIILNKTNPELFPEGTGEPPSPPTQQDQNNALMAHAQLTKLVAEAQKTEAEAEDAEMDAALKGMQVAQLAAQGPVNAAVTQAVMEVLAKFGVSDQGQPGPQGAGAAPAPQPQPVAPVGA